MEMGDVMSIGLFSSNGCAQKSFAGWIELIEAIPLNLPSAFQHKLPIAGRFPRRA